MNRLTNIITISGIALLCLTGCGDVKKSSTKQETTISTPSGKTTITTEKEVKRTENNPPTSTP